MRLILFMKKSERGGMGVGGRLKREEIQLFHIVVQETNTAL